MKGRKWPSLSEVERIDSAHTQHAEAVLQWVASMNHWHQFPMMHSDWEKMRVKHSSARFMISMYWWISCGETRTGQIDLGTRTVGRRHLRDSTEVGIVPSASDRVCDFHFLFHGVSLLNYYRQHSSEVLCSIYVERVSVHHTRVLITGVLLFELWFSTVNLTDCVWNFNLLPMSVVHARLVLRR